MIKSSQKFWVVYVRYRFIPEQCEKLFVNLNTFNFKKSTLSTSSASDANVKVSVKMPDMKERKHSAKVVRKSKVIYYMADEDLKYLKKKTRYTEGELR